MKVCQVNLQHSKAAAIEMGKNFDKGLFDMVLIQEPYIKDNIVNISTQEGHILYQQNNGKVRSCILVRKGVKCFMLQQFTNKDEVTVKVSLSNDHSGNMDVIFCSGYFPYDSDWDPPSQNIRNLVDFCSKNDVNLIVGCDANAHNVVWGSSDTNKRGESLLDFMLIKELLVLNEGNKPTFGNSIREEVIDITFSNREVCNMISKWQVSDEPSLSDHKYITFEVMSCEVVREGFRNPRNTDWIGFKCSLINDLQELNWNLNSHADAEQLSQNLNVAILKAYNGNCKVSKPSKHGRCKWYSSDLERMRKTVRRKWNKSRKLVRQGFSIAEASLQSGYKESLTMYSRAVKEATFASWKRKCEEIEKFEDCARIHKLMSKRNADTTIGALRKEDGSFTLSSNESLQVLLKTHFPGSSIIDGGDVDYEDFGTSRSSDDLLAQSVITESRITWAINSLKPFKSPGVDGILPVFLQKGLVQLMPFLLNLFRYSLHTGYIPNAWRKVKVVFIPKPGKDTYAEAKSFRPISLMSFLLKVLEKMVDRFIRDEILTLRPLSVYQFAYQAGKSTDAALHSIVSRIEKGFTDKDFMVGGLVDIEGAFDNTGFEVITNSLQRRGIPESLTEWINNMLRSRIVHASQNGEVAFIRAMRGTPQGGNLSCLLWSLVIDDLLMELNGSGGIFAQGYADDVFILVKGKFTSTVLEVFQRSLNIVQSFCNRVGLSVNPAKTTVIPFTTRYKLGDLRPPTMYGQMIDFSYEAKYLGVNLDSKLNWNAHIDLVVSKVTKSFWACRSIVGKNWGLKPSMMYWLYEQVILPRLTYGCVVWWNKMNQVNASQKLEKLQRMAELTICGAWKTTPKLALDRFLELPPLRIRIEAVAQSSACKLAVNKLWVYDWIFTGHMELNRFLRGIKLYTLETDHLVSKHVFDKSFKVVLFEDNETTPFDFVDNEYLCVYTDASKSEAGVGIGMFSNDLNIKLSYKLQDHATVFQAEVQAICVSVNYCLDMNLKGHKICFLTDSRSALLALNNSVVRSLTVLDCISGLSALGHENEVILRWIPGHRGIEGNETADQLAKEAVHKEIHEKSVYYGFGMLKSDIREWVERQHFRLWNLEEGAMMAKKLMGPRNKNRLSDALKLSRRDLSILIGALTGHMSINSFLFKLNLTDSKFCRFCSRDEETIIHILCNCRSLCMQRTKYFNKDFVTAEDIRKQHYSDIVGFIKDTGILA